MDADLPSEVSLHPMAEEVIETCLALATEDMRTGGIRAGLWTEAESANASARSIRMFYPTLREGVENSFWTVHHIRSGRDIGLLWGMLDFTGVPSALSLYLHIDPTWRCGGMGRAALLAWERIAAERGVQRHMVQVFGNNQASHAMIHALGFELTMASYQKALRATTDLYRDSR